MIKLAYNQSISTEDRGGNDIQLLLELLCAFLFTLIFLLYPKFTKIVFHLIVACLPRGSATASSI